MQPRFANLILYLVLFCATEVFAIDQVGLQIAELQGDDWSATGVSLTFSSSGKGAPSPDSDDLDGGISLTIESLHHSAFARDWKNIQIQCPQLSLGQDLQQCIKGLFSTQQGPYGRQKAAVTATYRDADNWRLGLKNLALAGGTVHADLHSRDSHWRLKVKGSGLQLGRLSELSPEQQLPAGWSLAGRASVSGVASGQGAVVEHVETRLSLAEVNYSDPEGLQVAENLAARVELNAKQIDHHQGMWKAGIKVEVSQGQLYSDPVFLEVKLRERPIQIASDLHWDSARERFQFRQIDLVWPDVLTLKGDITVLGPGLNLQSSHLEMNTQDLSALYSQLLQPFLIGQVVDDLEVLGEARMLVSSDAEGLTMASLELKDLHLDHQQGLFGLYDGALDIHWSRDEIADLSHFSLAGGHVSRLDFEGFSGALQFNRDSLVLVTPLKIPMMGGHVELPSFIATHMGEPNQNIELSAAVSDLSMTKISSALDWPAFDGTLTGRLPKIQYRNKQLQLSGGLSVELFGGSAVLTNLVIHEPLGPAPRIETEAFMHHLDLKQVTGVFSFGQIEGSLNAEVRDLELIAWSPSHFNARFFSPEQDDRRHRISQGAVDDLTALGNGVSGALSGTFLRFFDNFSYDRIELRVDLDANRAILGGIEHSSGGYYLVKGAGLPRIDVIGRTHQIAWKDLVDRLQAIRFDDARIN